MSQVRLTGVTLRMARMVRTKNRMSTVADQSILRSYYNDAAEMWYWAAATYKEVHVGVARRRHLWQRIVFLVRAQSDSDAAEQARRIALSKEHEYLAAGGDTIRWVLQEIEGVQSLAADKIEEGTEVYWTFFERVDKTTTFLAPEGLDV